MSSGEIEHLLDALQRELAEERERKKSVEGRSITLAGASIASLALLFGLGIDYAGERLGLVLILIGAAALCFVGAVVLCVLSALPKTYKELSPVNYRRWMQAAKESSLEDRQLLLDLAEGALTAFADARDVNGRKATLLLFATIFALGGAAFIFSVVVAAIWGLL